MFKLFKPQDEAQPQRETDPLHRIADALERLAAAVEAVVLKAEETEVVFPDSPGPPGDDWIDLTAMGDQQRRFQHKITGENVLVDWPDEEDLRSPGG